MSQTNYTYEERQAIAVLRKAIIKKPQIIHELMRDQAHGLAETVLVKARDELTALLEVNQAFVAAAKALVDSQANKRISAGGSGDEHAG